MSISIKPAPCSSILGSSRRKPAAEIARTVLLAAVASLLPVAASQAANWTNTDISSRQNWNVGTNWSPNGVPTGGSASAIFNTNASVLINSAVPSISTFTMQGSYDEDLLIANGGSLSITSTSATAFRLQTTGSHQVTVDSGGALSVAGTTVMQGTGSKITNAGTFSTVILAVNQGGMFQMTGGTLNATQSYGSIALGQAGSTDANDGKFIQSGGTVNATNTGVLQLNSGGTYEISGGSISATNGIGALLFNGATATAGVLGGTIHVVGSKATSISFGGLRYIDNTYDRAKATWAFTMDNGANHITKIKFTGNGNAGGNVRSGTLNVDLSGGVMLSGTNAMTLIEGSGLKSTSNFVNAADFEGATAKLWTQNMSSTALKVTLTGAANKGTLDQAGISSASFTASSYGYVNLDNIDLDYPMTLSLDITGGTLSKFTDSLTAAGIEWTEGLGDYELAISLDPVTSGGNYFAWDFSGIDGAMGLQGVAITSVPEPSTWILLAGSVGMLTILRRRRAVLA